MPEKKLGKVTVHTTHGRKQAIDRLAEQKGVSASEYVDEIMDKHLQSRFSELSVLLTYQEAQGAVSAVSASMRRGGLKVVQ